MLCLHGKPAVALGKKSWTCGDVIHNPRCFICFEEEKPLYDKAIKAFLATKQDIPKCCGIIHPDKVSLLSTDTGARTGVNLYNLKLMPDDTTLNSGCTQEKSNTNGGLPTKRILVVLFSCAEKVLKGTPEVVVISSGEIKPSLQGHCVTTVRSVV